MTLSGDYANSAEYQQVRENVLIEGLMDAVSLGEIHTAFMYEAHQPKRSPHEAQHLTLALIRELIADGLFVPGIPDRHGRFEEWSVSLGVLMARIEDAYVKKFDDRWGWTAFVWLNQTEKGKQLAEALYHGDSPADPES